VHGKQLPRRMNSKPGP